MDALTYKIALSLLPQIGDVGAKKLLSYCGSAEQVFREKRSILEKIPGIGGAKAKSIRTSIVFERAEKERKFIDDNNIVVVFYQEANYPKRLTYCVDSPILLYMKGDVNLNSEKIISVVGTRDASNYGKKMCEQLIYELVPHDVIIVSGLAYGIDTYAHRSALDNGLRTIGVFAHGFDIIYPAANYSLAKKMLGSGAWLSDFTSGTKPDKENFPKRNRIVAGITDATIVIESKVKGGSLITAEIANSYNRDVFAFPGKADDINSVGCNNLIKQHKAALIQSANDISYLLGWDKTITAKKTIQKQLFVELKPEEELLTAILKERGQLSVDDLCLVAQLPMSSVSAILLSLEFSGIVKSLPGKIYQLN